MIDRFQSIPTGERILFILWAIWLLLILIAAFRVFGFLIARRIQDRKWSKPPAAHLSAAVIVPVKGFDLQSTPRFFDALFAQDYPQYRVIVCFESWNDPVAVWLKDQFDLSENAPVWFNPDDSAKLTSVTLACAGPSADEGQKVHNQRAAFESLDDLDRIVVFADADIHCKSDWLTKLVAPINHGTHRLSTTYRWLVPKRPTLPNQVASVINGSIATQGGSEATNVLWGGSMAITHDLFQELDVPHLLKGSLNDDLRLSKAARKTGNRIAFVRSIIMPTMIDFNWSGFFEFAKRQYTQVKFFSPILYTGTNFVLGFYVAGALSILTALVYGFFWAWIPIAAAYVIDQFRALTRQQVYLSLFPENGIRTKLFAACWLEHMLTPFWMFLHWALLVSTWTQNRIQWAGIDYRILSKSKTQILHRPEATERLPVGVPGLALLAEIHDQRRTGYTQPIQATTPVEEPFLQSVEPSEPEIAPVEPTAPIEPDLVPEQAEPASEQPAIEPVETGREEVEELAEPVEASPEAIKPASETPAPRPVGVSAVVPLTVAFPSKRAKRPPAKATRQAGKSILQTRLDKTRIRESVRQDVGNRTLSPSLPPSGKSVSKEIEKVSPIPSSSPKPEDSFLPASRSFAARRSGPGHVFRNGASPRPPARSSRANQASRGVSQSHVRLNRPRKTARGASARP